MMGGKQKMKKKKKKKTTKQGNVREASSSKMESLPSELIMDILSRVPTLELGNLRGVCKRWTDIVRVKDPSFRTLHSSHSMSEPTENNNLLLQQGPNHLYFVDSAATSCRHSEVMIYTPWIPGIMQCDVIGSCNGLLCLGTKAYGYIFVMNPFTRQHVCLAMEFCGYIWSWGFGFESVKKIYKVVVVGDNKLHDAPGLTICDLDSGLSSNWRYIGWEDTLDFKPSSESPACFVNGRLHWTHKNGSSFNIVSFDLVDEEFRSVPVPDYLRYRRKFDLFVLRGCLSIIRSQPSVTPRLEIWIMKEYGVKESWVKEVDTVPIIPKSLFSEFDESSKKRKRLTLKGLGSLRDGKVLLECKITGIEAILFSSDPTCDRFRFLEFQNQRYFTGSVIHTASIGYDQIFASRAGD